MNTRPLFRLLFLSAFALGTLPAVFAHDSPYGLQHIPPATPTVDPGPNAAVLRVRIVDATSREPTPATASVNGGAHEPDDDPFRAHSLRRSANRHKGAIRWRDVPYYFFTDGRFEVRVPPGPVSVRVGKGYEYRPVELTVTVTAKETRDVEIVLERSIDMAALGWYSGDTHIHLERTGTNDDTLLSLTAAKDIRYAYLLSFNTRGYDPAGIAYESHLQRTGLGEGSIARRGPYHITSGHEYRAAGLGHVTLVMPDRYVPASGKTDDASRGPSFAVIADQTRALRGFLGFAHGGYANQQADQLALEGRMDFLELLQFGEYRSLGLSGWYDYLYIGYRLPMAGASDFPPTRELASEMTYVWSDTVPTPRSFMEGISAGRSFATSGPMLFLTVDGRKPGESLRFPEGSTTNLIADVVVRSPQFPVRYLELIVNGEVVERRFDERGRSEWSLRHMLPMRASSWIAARAYSDAGTDSHTNPVYVFVGNTRPFSAASARQIIARLEGSIAAIRLPAVVAELEKLKQELQAMIRTGRSGLPLPDIGR